MTDVFEEVEEQLRSARYQAFISKGWPYIVAALVIGILGYGAVAFVRTQQSAATSRASEQYEAGLEAVDKRDRATAEARFAEVAKSGPPAYRAAALMQQAGYRAGDRKTAEAIALLDQAAEISKDPVVGDVARLKAAYLAFDTASLADLEKRLTPLTSAGRPYVALAREALAMKRMATGQGAAARQVFSLLAISPDAGEGLQARAGLATAVIDAGETAQLAAAAKAAAALPPGSVPPAAPPGPPPGQDLGPAPSGAQQ